MFAGSERLKDFLRYITEETLQGRGEHIKDYVVGVEVYHKSPSFDIANGFERAGGSVSPAVEAHAVLRGRRKR